MSLINCVEALQNLADVYKSFPNQDPSDCPSVNHADGARDVVVVKVEELSNSSGIQPIATDFYEFELRDGSFMWYHVTVDLARQRYQSGWGQMARSPFGPGAAALKQSIMKRIKESQLPAAEIDNALTYIDGLPE